MAKTTSERADAIIAVGSVLGRLNGKEVLLCQHLAGQSRATDHRLDIPPDIAAEIGRRTESQQPRSELHFCEHCYDKVVAMLAAIGFGPAGSGKN